MLIRMSLKMPFKELLNVMVSDEGEFEIQYEFEGEFDGEFEGVPRANEPGAAAGASCHLRPTKVADDHLLFSFLPHPISSNRVIIHHHHLHHSHHIIFTIIDIMHCMHGDSDGGLLKFKAFLHLMPLLSLILQLTSWSGLGNLTKGKGSEKKHFFRTFN